MCVKQDILATLSYFDIFNYPITQTEIYLFLGSSCSHEELTASIQDLIIEKWIFQFGGFYTLQNNYSLVSRRCTGNLKAKKLIHISEKVAGILSYFPFVRGIAVSGSLSKNFADEKSDIDLFIITAKNRLWLARTFMHCFKKLTFLLNKQHFFCMNYYIDEEMLQIKEKNIYTATEIITLLPLRGIEIFKKFYQKNVWSKSYFPNHTLKASYTKEIHHPLFKKIVELILDNPIGALIDQILMNITERRWSEKTGKGKLNNRGIVMSMDANKHYAKPDPQNFQNKFLDLYKRKVDVLMEKYEQKEKSLL